jgi:hypothetical protein
MIGIDYWVLRPTPYTPLRGVLLGSRVGWEKHYLRVVGMLGRYPVFSDTSAQRVRQDDLKWTIRQRLRQPRLDPRRIP